MAMTYKLLFYNKVENFAECSVFRVVTASQIRSKSCDRVKWSSNFFSNYLNCWNYRLNKGMRVAQFPRGFLEIFSCRDLRYICIRMNIPIDYGCGRRCLNRCGSSAIEDANANIINIPVDFYSLRCQKKEKKQLSDQYL